MRRRDYYWTLYDTQDRRQVPDLRTDQVEAVYESMAESLRARWIIWRDGFQNWKKFGEFPLLIEQLRNQPVGPAAAPTPPQSVSEVEKMEMDIEKSLSGLEFSDATQDFKRATARYEGKFAVTIQGADGLVFKSHTSNISLYGMQLVDALPAWLPKYFHIQVANKTQFIVLLCSVVKGPDGKLTNRVKIEANDYYHVLKDWLFKAV